MEKVELSMKHIQSVMYLGHKYQIDGCLKICSTFLMEHLTVNEMCRGYQMAIRYEQTDLKNFCLRRISMNAETVLKTDGFLECDWILLNDIVKFDKLLCRETTLLEACIKWGRNECERNDEKHFDEKSNIRKCLGGVIYEIRFREINWTEFGKHYVDSLKLYDCDELIEIDRIMKGENIISTKFNCSPRFNSVISNVSTLPPIECQRRSNKTSNYYILHNKVSLIFSSNKILAFVGFSVSCKPLNNNFRYDISVQRLDTKTQIVETLGQAGNEVNFTKPLIVHKNIKYKIHLDFSSNDTKVVSNSKFENKVELDNGATIIFHQDTTTEFNNVEKGVITHLYFRKIDF